ncbi:MAG TPA: endonuclease MutS2, partial [Planctomycetota bacterium]|nr:endonuclease MutS2 [Planctomycetota bacterium]
FASEGITVKNGRYVLAVKTDYRSWVPGPIRDRSHKGGTLYIEPDEAVIDADRLEVLLDKERDEETRLLLELTRTVLDRRREIERLQRRLARVDFTYAKASWAAAFRLECPEVALDGDLELHEARHPWLLWLARDRTRDIRDPDIEALEKRVVPLDLRLGESSRILIITGPNTGGKTVVLKAVGLCVLLALSGIPIPARRGSRVPLYSSVFADIGDEQSLEQSLSTFSAHLTRIVEVLRHADERSLILLDELGSGTDPLEGAALGRALLDHFRARDWSVVITTHLGSLKQYAFLHEGVDNAAMEFDRENLRPTYRLLLGVPGSSSALAIAKRLGLPDEIIQDAAKEIEAVEEPTRELISSMERSRRRIEKERRRAERVRQRAQVGAREYEERLRELEERRELLEREAELEVERVVREAREKLRALAERLKSVP